MVGWQRHQLDHTQIICILRQTDNHASTQHPFPQLAGCPPSWCALNSIKALNAITTAMQTEY